MHVTNTHDGSTLPVLSASQYVYGYFAQSMQ